MIVKCRQATRRQSRLTWCTEVIAVSAVVTDTAVDTGRTKASIGMAISTAPNPAALRTANAPIITSMKKTTPSRDKDDTLRISRPSAHLGQCSVPEGRAATKFRGIAGPASNWATAMFDGFGATRVDPPALPDITNDN